MKKKIYIVLGLCTLMTFYSCSVDTLPNESAFLMDENDVSNHIKTPSKSQATTSNKKSSDVPNESSTFDSSNTPPVIENEELEFVIHRMRNREDFESFLKDPTLVIPDLTERFVLANCEETYCPAGELRSIITPTLFDFVTQKANLQSYLADNEVNAKVKDAVLIDSFGSPMTIWIKTDDKDYYIVIERFTYGSYSYEDDISKYELFTHEEYTTFFSIKPASLLVNGELIGDEKPAKLYSYYADIPLVMVLESLGATVSWQDATNATIVFNDKTFKLNLSEQKSSGQNIAYLPTLYETGSDDGLDLLFLVHGGYVFIEAVDKEVYMDNHSFRCTLSSMMDIEYLDIIMDIDRENRLVNIAFAD